MNDLDKVIVRANQLESLAFTLEGAILAATSEETHTKETGRMIDLFYVLMEQIDLLNKELDELNGHNLVCNAIFAVNHVNELRAEIEELKAGV